MISLAKLSDADVTESTKKLVGHEHKVTFTLLEHLNEIERRGIYLREGFSSLFHFCITALKYSESAASRRIRSARLIRRFPDAEILLKDRKISFTTAAQIFTVLDASNQDEILSAVVGIPQKEVYALVARYQDPNKNRTPDRITPLTVLPPNNRLNSSPLLTQPREPCGQTPTYSPPPNPQSVIINHDSHLQAQGSIPNQSFQSSSIHSTQAEERLRITFGAEREFLQLIEKAKQILSGKYPMGASLEEVFREALRLLIEKYDPERRAERRTNEEKNSNSATKSKGESSHTILHRQIPIRIRDEVFKRDGGKCTYISPSGQQCQSTWDLEVDHIRPFSMGGDHSLDNLRLLCRAHNNFRNK